MIDPWGTLDKLAKDDRSSGLRYTEQKNLLNSSAFSKGLGTFSVTHIHSIWDPGSLSFCLVEGPGKIWILF